MMVERGRQEAPMPLDIWLDDLERDPLLNVLPLTARIVLGRGFEPSFRGPLSDGR